MQLDCHFPGIDTAVSQTIVALISTTGITSATLLALVHLIILQQLIKPEYFISYICNYICRSLLVTGVSSLSNASAAAITTI
jgi:hypothetical protein